MRRRPGRPLVIAAAAFTFLLTSGCGDQPAEDDLGPVLTVAADVPQSTPLETAAPEPTPEPCAVLTAAAVQQVLGEPADLVNNHHGCDYLTRGQPATLVGLSVDTITGATPADFAPLTEEAATATPDSTTWPVSGLGEAATAITSPQATTLHVKTADTYLVFNLVDPSADPEASLATLQQLALTTVPTNQPAAR